MSYSQYHTLAISLGIVICIAQAGIFSGLNLGIFSVSRLRLEVEAAGGNEDARGLLELREKSNLTLATILWGSVANNVLLTLLSESILAGLGAFLFSTIIITLLGEVVPQAYFSRNAMRLACRFSGLLRFYEFALFPVAKPTALVLDRWLGPENTSFFREQDFRALMSMHAQAVSSDIGRLESIGALNFLELDDVPVSEEGQAIDPRSIVVAPHLDGRPTVPRFETSPNDSFFQQLAASGKKWVIFVDDAGNPSMVLNFHRFLCDDAISRSMPILPEDHWHRPIVVRDMNARLGDVIGLLKIGPDDIVDQDVVLLWSKQKRILTGADILGRLLRGIAKDERKPGSPASPVA